jgi:GNAT superfamily N-acetyltransferase
MDATIRRASACDAEALTELMHSSSAYRGEYARILENYAVTADQIERDLIFAVEAESGLLGFYSLTLIGEPELDLMFVADAMRGTGLGRLLFEHMRAQAADRGIERVRIVSHPPATGFYEAMGSVHAGVSPPSGKASWSRPILCLPIEASRSADQDIGESF